MDVKLGEIVYCNLKIKHNKRTHELNKVVYKKTDGFYYNKRILDDFNIKEKVLVCSVEVISRLGFESKSKGFTEVKASNEKRNKITGAYE